VKPREREKDLDLDLVLLLLLKPVIKERKKEMQKLILKEKEREDLM